jgi:hypothetical protein
MVKNSSLVNTLNVQAQDSPGAVATPAGQPRLQQNPENCQFLGTYSRAFAKSMK